MIEILITYDIENAKDATHYNKVKSKLFYALAKYGRLRELAPESSLKLIRDTPLDEKSKLDIKTAIRIVAMTEGVTIKYAIK